MHRRLLGAGPSAVDAGVPAHAIRLGRGETDPACVRVRVVVGQAARPRFAVVPAPDQIVLVLSRLGGRVEIRLLLEQQLVQRLPRPHFGRSGKTTRTRPPIGRLDGGIERIMDEVVVERVRRVEHALVLDVVPLPYVVDALVLAHRSSGRLRTASRRTYYQRNEWACTAGRMGQSALPG